MNHSKNRINIKYIFSYIVLTCFFAALISGCTVETENNSELSNQTVPVSATVDTLLSITDSNSLFTAEDKEIGYSDADSSLINLSGEKIFSDSDGVEIDNSTATITSEGTYIITGNLTGGKIVIDTDSKSDVRLVLDGADIENSLEPAIQVENAGRLYITLNENTENSLSGNLSFSQNSESAGVIYSNSDITLNGRGNLNISSSSGSGIVSEKNITITGGTIDISSGRYGISAAESVRISSAMISVVSKNNGIVSFNDENDSSGFIYISDGIFKINSEGSAIDAKNILLIDGGAFNITTSPCTQLNEDGNGYGLKAGEEISVNSGDFVFSTSDNAVNSNSKISINGGSFTISSEKNGIDGKSTVLIGESTIDIIKSHIGIEGETVFVQGGILNITSEDDGINAAGGNDGSGLTDSEEPKNFSSAAGIKILGGYISINASGDGMDSGKDIAVSDGIIFLSTADNEDDTVIDFTDELFVTGGTILAAGNSSQEKDFSDCGQKIILLDIDSQPQNCFIEICDESGNTIISGTSAANFSSVFVTGSQFEKGCSYILRTESYSASFTI